MKFLKAHVIFMDTNEAVRQEIVKTCRTGVGNAVSLLEIVTGAP
jgi:hypothetical protein